MSTQFTIPSVSSYAQMAAPRAQIARLRPMQERAYQKRGEQYLLIKSPPASGKRPCADVHRLDKLQKPETQTAIIVVPEKSIGSSFYDEPLSQSGFWADWK